MEIKIEQLERHSATGIVFTVHWRCNMSETVDGVTYNATTYGTQSLDEPDGNIIPYAELTPEVVTGWLIDKWGAEQIESMESSLVSQIEAQKNPPTSTGLPW